jgi:hypothetical protein
VAAIWGASEEDGGDFISGGWPLSILVDLGGRLGDLGCHEGSGGEIAFVAWSATGSRPLGHQARKFFLSLYSCILPILCSWEFVLENCGIDSSIHHHEKCCIFCRLVKSF